MTGTDTFWKLDGLSDRELVDRLSTVLGSGRRLTAELVAHLGEVEARRLHLQAACGSMFQYCVTKLRLSEDEACRRIEVARLARRFPEIFPLLASGALSLSIVAVLTHYLSAENASELLALVRGQTLQRAREMVAARFPRPDVPASIRKLPSPRTRMSGSEGSAGSTPTALAFDEVEAPVIAALPQPLQSAQPSRSSMIYSSRSNGLTLAPDAEPPSAALHAAERLAAAPLVLALTPSRSPDADQPDTPVPHPDARARLEPLSAERYRVQFTASLQLKRKLELARDLMRHAQPNGDLAAIIERSLDLLIDHLMKRRFGKNARPSPARSASPGRVRSATRRLLLERDGLQCSWVNEQGERCPATAWLEHDHLQARAKGGSSEPHNTRILCRAHNQWSAERDYGKAHIQRAIARRKTRSPPS